MREIRRKISLRQCRSFPYIDYSNIDKSHQRQCLPLNRVFPMKINVSTCTGKPKKLRDAFYSGRRQMICVALPVKHRSNNFCGTFVKNKSLQFLPNHRMQQFWVWFYFFAFFFLFWFFGGFFFLVFCFFGGFFGVFFGVFFF